MVAKEGSKIHLGYVILEVVVEHPIRKIFLPPQPQIPRNPAVQLGDLIVPCLRKNLRGFCFQSLISRSDRPILPKGKTALRVEREEHQVPWPLRGGKGKF